MGLQLIIIFIMDIIDLFRVKELKKKIPLDHQNRWRLISDSCCSFSPEFEEEQGRAEQMETERYSRSVWDSGRMLVTGSCSVSSAPVIAGNLGHFQPVHM